MLEEVQLDDCIPVLVTIFRIFSGVDILLTLQLVRIMQSKQ